MTENDNTINGFIKIWRSFLKWEWYDDIPTKVLFLHILLKANHKNKKWHGIDVERGSFVSGRKTLSMETGLSEMQIRTSLNKLKSTNEIRIKTTKQNSIIYVNNYDEYQQNFLTKSNNCDFSQKSNQQNNQQITNGNPVIERQTGKVQPTNNQQNSQQITNEQPTNNQQITTTKESKKVKNDKKYINNNNNEKNFLKIPTKKEIEDFSHSLGKVIDVDSFFAYWNEADWLDKSGFPVNWKQKVISWANRTRSAPTKQNTLSGMTQAAKNKVFDDLRAYVEEKINE